MSKIKVLIVEDDEVSAMHLNITLKKLRYNVVSIAKNTIQARNKIKIYEPDIILLDISLQESTDGIDLAVHIKDKYPIPFIYLSSHAEENILQEAKTTQPYGYIVKPFDPKSLHSTIQMAIYKFKEECKLKENLTELETNREDLEKLIYTKKISSDSIITFSNEYKFDINSSETFYKNTKIKLTKKENAFIKILATQPGHIVSFEQAISYIWEEGNATENSVRTLVWRLRNKLPTDIIKNASGIGYYIEDERLTIE